MRDRRHLIVFVTLLFVCCLAFLPAGCRNNAQPAETNTKGNATDRDAATGTSGTGEPASPSTATTAAAQQLGTVAPSAANGAPVALTGTEEVHAQKTETTSTLQGPGGTSTAAVATPTDTTATFKTTTGTSTAAAKKH
jgi:hypothetical protein